MRRTLGFSAFTLGWLLIFLSPLLYFYARPRVEKAPTDTYEKTISVGSGSYFSVKTLSVIGPTALENVSLAKGDPAKSTHDVAVVGIFSRTRDVAQGDFDFSYSVYAFNRSTGYGVDCCGAKPVAVGLTLKFPFHTKKATYLFWDSTAQRAFPAKYVRTDSVEDVDAYVFISRVPQTFLRATDVPGGVVGREGEKSVTLARYYDAVTTLWVEPYTGAILKASQHSRQWFADESGRPLLILADVDFTNDQRSVRSVAARISHQVWQLKMVSTWLPIAGPVAGVLLLLGGLLLMRSGDRRERGEGAVAATLSPEGISTRSP